MPDDKRQSFLDSIKKGAVLKRTGALDTSSGEDAYPVNRRLDVEDQEKYFNFIQKIKAPLIEIDSIYIRLQSNWTKIQDKNVEDGGLDSKEAESAREIINKLDEFRKVAKIVDTEAADLNVKVTENARSKKDSENLKNNILGKIIPDKFKSKNEEENNDEFDAWADEKDEYTRDSSYTVKIDHKEFNKALEAIQNYLNNEANQGIINVIIQKGEAIQVSKNNPVTEEKKTATKKASTKENSIESEKKSSIIFSEAIARRRSAIANPEEEAIKLFPALETIGEAAEKAKAALEKIKEKLDDEEKLYTQIENKISAYDLKVRNSREQKKIVLTDDRVKEVQEDLTILKATIGKPETVVSKGALRRLRDFAALIKETTFSDSEISLISRLTSSRSAQDLLKEIENTIDSIYKVDKSKALSEDSSSKKSKILIPPEMEIPPIPEKNDPAKNTETFEPSIAGPMRSPRSDLRTTESEPNAKVQSQSPAETIPIDSTPTLNSDISSNISTNSEPEMGVFIKAKEESLNIQPKNTVLGSPVNPPSPPPPPPSGFGGPPPPPPPPGGGPPPPPPPPPPPGAGGSGAGRKKGGTSQPVADFKKAVPAWQVPGIVLGTSSREEIESWMTKHLNASTLKSNVSGANANFMNWRTKYAQTNYGPYQSLYRYKDLTFTNPQAHLDNFYTLEKGIFELLKQQMLAFDENEKIDPALQAAFEKVVIEIQKLNFQNQADSRTQAVKSLERFIEARNSLRIKAEVASKIDQGEFQDQYQASLARQKELTETIAAINGTKTKRDAIQEKYRDHSTKEYKDEISALEAEKSKLEEKRRSLEAGAATEDAEAISLGKASQILAELDAIQANFASAVDELKEADSEQIEALRARLAESENKLSKIAKNINDAAGPANNVLKKAEKDLAASSVSSRSAVPEAAHALLEEVTALRAENESDQKALETNQKILKSNPKNQAASKKKSDLEKEISKRKDTIDRKAAEIARIEEAHQQQQPLAQSQQRTPQEIAFERASAIDNIYKYVQEAFNNTLGDINKIKTSLDKLKPTEPASVGDSRASAPSKGKVQRDLYLSGFELNKGNLDPTSKGAISAARGIVATRIDLQAFSKAELANIALFTASDAGKLDSYLDAIEAGNLNELKEDVGQFIQSNAAIDFSKFLDIASGRLVRNEGSPGFSGTSSAFLTENVTQDDTIPEPNSVYRIYRQTYFKDGMGSTPKNQWNLNIGYLNDEEKERLAQFFFNDPFNTIGQEALADKVNETLKSQGACFIDIMDIYQGKLVRKQNGSLENIFDDVEDSRPTGTFEDRESLFKTWTKDRQKEIKRNKDYQTEQKKLEQEKQERIEKAKEAAIEAILNSAADVESTEFNAEEFQRVFTSALTKVKEFTDEERPEKPPTLDIVLSAEEMAAARELAAARIEKAKEDKRTQAEKDEAERLRGIQIQEAVNEAKGKTLELLKLLRDNPNLEVFQIVFNSKLAEITKDKNLGDLSSDPSVVLTLEDLKGPDLKAAEVTEDTATELPFFDLDDETFAEVLNLPKKQAAGLAQEESEANVIANEQEIAKAGTKERIGDTTDETMIAAVQAEELEKAPKEAEDKLVHDLNEEFNEALQRPGEIDLHPEDQESDTQEFAPETENKESDIKEPVIKILDRDNEAALAATYDYKPRNGVQTMLERRGKASSDENVTQSCQNLKSETADHAKQLQSKKQKIVQNANEAMHIAFLQDAALILAADSHLKTSDKGYLYLGLLQNLDHQLTEVTASPVKKFISEEIGRMREMGFSLTGARSSNAQMNTLAYLNQTGLNNDYPKVASDITKTALTLQSIERTKESQMIWQHLSRQMRLLKGASNGYLPNSHPQDWMRFVSAVRDLRSLAPQDPQQHPVLCEAVWNAYQTLKQDLKGEYYLDPETNRIISQGFDWVSFDRAFSTLFPAQQQLAIQKAQKAPAPTILTRPARDMDSERIRDEQISNNLGKHISGGDTSVLVSYKNKEDDVAAIRNVFQRIGRSISGEKLSQIRESQIRLIQDVIDNLNKNETLSTYEKGQLYYTMLKMMQGELSGESTSRLKAFLDDAIADFKATMNPGDINKSFHAEMLQAAQLMSYLRQNNFHNRYNTKHGQEAYKQLELFLKTYAELNSNKRVLKEMWPVLDQTKDNLSSAISNYLPTNHKADWAKFEAAYNALKSKSPDSPNQHPQLLLNFWEALQKLQQDMSELGAEGGFEWKPILVEFQPLLPMQVRLELSLYAKTPMSLEDEYRADDRSTKAIQFRSAPENKTKPVIDAFLEQHRKSGPQSLEKILNQHQAKMSPLMNLLQETIDNIHYDASLTADQKIQITYGLIRSVDAELKSLPDNSPMRASLRELKDDFYRRVETSPAFKIELIDNTRESQEAFIKYIGEHANKLKIIGKELPRPLVEEMTKITSRLNNSQKMFDRLVEQAFIIGLLQPTEKLQTLPKQLNYVVQNSKRPDTERQDANLLKNTIEYLTKQTNMSPDLKGHILMSTVDYLVSQHSKDKKSELMPILNNLQKGLNNLYISDLQVSKQEAFKSFLATAPLSGRAWERMKSTVEAAQQAKAKGRK
ncbi:MAG: hypothetical protein U1E78_06770 [Gammaproteobacteria bacterium]